MAGSIFLETARQLEKIAHKNPAIIVSYSGGKDSLALLNLCCQAFQTVVACHMFFVPGLECVEQWLDFARDRWGVDVIQYQHWAAFRCMKYGIYCDNHYKWLTLPDFKVNDIYETAKADTGIPLVARGGKASDSLWRRRMLNAHNNNRGIIDPLKNWHKWDVLAYLRVAKIPMPRGDGEHRAASGVGLVTNSVCWLHDCWRADYEQLLETFPYAEAIVRRREWHGIGERYQPKPAADRPPEVREAVANQRRQRRARGEPESCWWRAHDGDAKGEEGRSVRPVLATA